MSVFSLLTQVCAECGTQSQGVLDEQQEWAQARSRPQGGTSHI